ncbi:hypothetical protein FHR32_005876 [Streptosporangium album]|uniref:Uncharacterized protein n=1 Tax=Streptosporangium album TaxID=47479 RepID=A0A7W7S072_9ACTN|nr:hypothetical protein [Streptosporangium album]
MPLEECLSPHVAMAQRDHARLERRDPYRTPDRIRPVNWTCVCHATVYELCQGGGQAFIRRTVQLDRKHEIHETSRWSLAEARVIWTALLSGRAR